MVMQRGRANVLTRPSYGASGLDDDHETPDGVVVVQDDSVVAGAGKEPLRISVIIATRDRPDQLARCLASVLACDHDSFEVVVVDQSVPPAPVPDDDRVVHIVTPTTGKSAGLNIGLAAASSDLLAFTDDDCTVPADWLERVEDVFARHPDVAMAFGELRPIPHDPSEVFVTPVELQEFRVVRNTRAAHVRGGAGANMAARRHVFDAIGPYDERIGPGSEFHACEEYDVYYRTLAAGRAVAFTPEVTTTHWGVRSYADGTGQLLKRRYAYGEGAVIGKHLRMGDPRMALVGARITAEDLRFVLSNLRQRRLTGLGQLIYKWQGLIRALLSRVDRRRRVFTG
jgi:glycosyltransferase involved in cell wall biosynthesis